MTTPYYEEGLEHGLIEEELRHINGYLASEKIVIDHIMRRLDNGVQESTLPDYLRSLVLHLETAHAKCEDVNVQTNYRFVIGFLYTLLRTPGWKRWLISLQP